jgi:4-diphosphocytidyl-2C-methyl-D-erythritol kinase
MRELTTEENKILIEAAKILKDAYKDEDAWIITVQKSFPVKIPEKQKINAFIYIVKND